MHGSGWVTRRAGVDAGPPVPAARGLTMTGGLPLATSGYPGVALCGCSTPPSVAVAGKPADRPPSSAMWDATVPTGTCMGGGGAVFVVQSGSVGRRGALAGRARAGRGGGGRGAAETCQEERAVGARGKAGGDVNPRQRHGRRCGAAARWRRAPARRRLVACGPGGVATLLPQLHEHR
jgi:hypothetical protein